MEASMRRAFASFLVGGCVLSAAIAFQARGDGAAAGKVCSLLARDLVMQAETAEGRKVLEQSEPIEDWVGTVRRENGLPAEPSVSSCKYGRVTLVLEPWARSEEVRKAMRTRTPPWNDVQPVSGVGDAAFFDTNSSYANLFVWTGARHFHIEMGVGLWADEDTEALKPNAVALANAIIPQLQ
jgi:hypothetical protein